MVEVKDVEQRAGLEAQKRARSPEWTAAFAKAQPRTPLLVKHLDDSHLDYYIVDFRTGTVPTGRMIFDASTGELGQIAGIDIHQPSMEEFLTTTQIQKIVLAQPINVGTGREPTKTISPDDFSIATSLEWRECDQSATPMQPFYRVDIRSRHAPLYVRIDGQP